MNRVKAASAGKPLQSCEMAIFLKVLPVLETLSQTLVERLEERLTAHASEGAAFCIGDVYLDMSALFVAYTSYASMAPEAEKVLNHPALAELAESLEEELAPLTMAQHLAVGVDVVLVCLRVNLKVTATILAHSRASPPPTASRRPWRRRSAWPCR